MLRYFLRRAVTQVTWAGRFVRCGGHGCWCRPGWHGGNSPPFGPPEGSQGWPQPAVPQSRSDRARFPRLSPGSEHASQTLNLLYGVTFEKMLTSGFCLFILYIYFAFVECVCLLKIGLISLCEFHLKTGSPRLSRALNGAH